MPPMKQGRVVDILTPSRLVLNVGSDDGVTFQSRFRVYAYGKEIVDPETAEILERVYLPRGNGRVAVLQKKICTIESLEREGQQFLYSLSAEPPKVVPFDNARIGDFADLIVEKKKEED